MRWLCALGAALMLAGLPGAGLGQAEYSGKLTKTAQIFDAPGPYPSQRGPIAADTPVEAEVCFAEGAYCLIKANGVSAFVEGELIAVPIGHGTATALELEQRKWERIRREAALPRTPDWERRNIVVWGDSLSTDYGQGGSFGDELQALLGGTREVVMQGIPGQDGAQIGDRMLADTQYTGRLQIIWDRHSSGQPVESYMADMRRMTERAAALGNRFIVVSDIPDLDGASDETGLLLASAADDAMVTERINAALRQQYPDTFIDVTGVLSDLSTRTDGLHLTQAGYEAVAKAIATFVQAKAM